ncbi:MAG: metallophosphoesterase, partial [Verrucomicrobiae bacterium]|nr:metallophosphoesterase [Verrucomicrobiae bacterium]
GGQVCAPFYGAIQLPSFGKKYVAGLFERGDQRLYVTRGIGSLGVPVRFCCPPEISLITMRAPATV